MTLTRPLVLLCAFGVLASEVMAGELRLPNYQQQSFSLPAGTDHFMAGDFNGDGLADLLVSQQSEIQVHWQRSQGFQLNKPDARVALPGNATAWSVDQQSNPPRLLALVDGESLQAWPLTAEGVGESTTLASGLAGSLPVGVRYLPFVRDVNGDQRNDVIVPAQDQLFLLLQNSDGNLADPLAVQAPVEQNSRLKPPANLRWSVGQSISIPALNFRDLNNDAQPDLIIETEERLAVFLADASGNLPLEPSYQLDLQALEQQVGEVDYDNIDYGNLSGLLSHTYEYHLADIDGDGIDDLLIREAGRIRLYTGTATGMPMEKPKQLLKSAGNVLGIMLRDEDGDGHPELWLTRLQDISVSNIFLWLAVSGSIDAETFIYRNTGDKFASRPHRKITVSMSFPSIFRSAGMVMDALVPPEQRPWPSVIANLSQSEEQADLLVLNDKSLDIYAGVVSNLKTDQAMLGVQDYRADKDNYQVDWGQILANPVSRAVRLAQQQAGREPHRRIALAPEFRAHLSSQAHLQTAKLNTDSVDDIIVLTEDKDGQLHVQLFLSQSVEHQ